MPSNKCVALAGESARASPQARERLNKPQAADLTLDNVAAMFKVSPFLLRYLEWRGLVKRRRIGAGAPVYSWFDCERIALIVKARDAGLAVDQFAVVIAAMDEEAETRVCESGQLQCHDLIGQLEMRQKRLSDVMSELRRIEWELSERVGPHE